MIIKKPTYEDMIPFLGRTVTIDDTRSGTTKTGCLVTIVANSKVYAGLYIDGCYDLYAGKVSVSLTDQDKAISIGPKNVIAFYCPNPTEIKIHEPSKNFSSSNKWLLAAPVVLRLFQ